MGCLDFIGGVAQAGGQVAAAKMTSDAATHAADLTSQAAKDTLAFQKQQAAQDLANFNSTNQANYNQWLPREQQISSLGSLVGLPARNIPAFAPTTNMLNSTQTTPNSGTLPAGGTSQTAPASTSSGYVNLSGQPIDVSPSGLAQQITQSYQTMAGRAPTADELANGIHYASTPDVYSDGQTRVGWNNYLATRLINGVSSADPSLAGSSGVIKATGAASGTTQKAPATQGSLASYVSQSSPYSSYVAPAPALQMPQYAPQGSLASMIGTGR